VPPLFLFRDVASTQFDYTISTIFSFAIAPVTIRTRDGVTLNIPQSLFDCTVRLPVHRSRGDGNHKMPLAFLSE